MPAFTGAFRVEMRVVLSTWEAPGGNRSLISPMTFFWKSWATSVQVIGLLGVRRSME